MREQRIFRELVATVQQGLLSDLVLPVAGDDPLPHTVCFDISDAVQSLLTLTNRLIYSPHTIEPSLLQPFLDGTREVRLVCVQNGKHLSATLQALHSSYLIVDTSQSVFRRKRGETVLVVFPVTPQQCYVLQTAIHGVYAFRLELEYRDPRYDVRHTIALPAPVTVQPAPSLVVAGLAQQQGRVLRHVSLTPRSAQGTAESVIADRFCPATIDAPTATPKEEHRALVGTLHDISLGGVCLLLETTQEVEALACQLVQLHIALPRASQALPEWEAVALTLHVLGIVRNISKASAARTLHIRFLKRLLPEVGALLWHLEGNTP